VGGWDAYNVTEDADLGLRLARFGYRTTTFDSTTGEEAPIRFVTWMKQRSRWMKGWMRPYCKTQEPMLFHSLSQILIVHITAHRNAVATTAHAHTQPIYQTAGKPYEARSRTSRPLGPRVRGEQSKGFGAGACTKSK
jgi:hypothetical protein